MPVQRTSALLDTRVVYCGDNLEQLQKLPDACVDLIYIDPPKPMQKGEGRIMKPARSPIADHPQNQNQRRRSGIFR